MTILLLGSQENHLPDERDKIWCDDVWWWLAGGEGAVGVRWVVRRCRSTIGRQTASRCQVIGEIEMVPAGRITSSDDGIFTWDSYLTLKVYYSLVEKYHFTWSREMGSRDVKPFHAISRHFTSQFHGPWLTSKNWRRGNSYFHGHSRVSYRGAILFYNSQLGTNIRSNWSTSDLNWGQTDGLWNWG